MSDIKALNAKILKELTKIYNNDAKRNFHVSGQAFTAETVDEDRMLFRCLAEFIFFTYPEKFQELIINTEAAHDAIAIVAERMYLGNKATDEDEERSKAETEKLFEEGSPEKMKQFGDPFMAYLNSVQGHLDSELENKNPCAEEKIYLLKQVRKAYEQIWYDDEEGEQ